MIIFFQKGHRVRLKIKPYAFALLFSSIITVGLIWRLDVTNKSVEFDQGLFLYTADRIANGVAQYTDDFDNMPPGIYYVYILGFKIFGNNPVATHMVTVLSDIGILALLFLLGYMLRGLTAAFAATGFYAGSFVMIRWAPKGSTENPMTLLLLVSLVIYFFATSRRNKPNKSLMIISGFFFGCAFLIKQPAIFFCLTPLILQGYLFWTERKPIPMIAGELAWFGGGFALPVAGVSLWLFSKGIFHRAIYNAFIFPFSAQREYGMLFGERWQEFLEMGLIYMPMLFAIGLGAMIVYLINHNYKVMIPVAYTIPVILYLFWTGDFFQHYLIQLAPGLALGGGLLVAHGFESEKKWFLKTILAVAVFLFFIGNLTRLNDAYIENRDQEARSKIFPTAWLRTNRDDQLDYQVMVGKYLKYHLKPGQKLVTSTPTYAYLAGVPNSYSQFYIAPLTRSASNEFYGLAESIREARFFVVEGWRTIYVPHDLHMEIKNKWRLVRWLSEEGIMDVEVWENPRFISPPITQEPALKIHPAINE